MPYTDEQTLLLNSRWICNKRAKKMLKEVSFYSEKFADLRKAGLAQMRNWQICDLQVRKTFMICDFAAGASKELADLLLQNDLRICRFAIC